MNDEDITRHDPAIKTIAKDLVLAAKLLRDTPSDLEAKRLVENYPPKLLARLEALADYDPSRLTEEQLDHVVSVGRALGRSAQHPLL